MQTQQPYGPSRVGAALLVLLIDCGTSATTTGPLPSGVDPANIPPGDAIGTELTGTYSVRFSVERVHCDRGSRLMTSETGDARFFQSDGVLEATFTHYGMPKLTGGVSASGAFSVGGVDHYGDHSYKKSYLVQGRIEPGFVDGSYVSLVEGADILCDALATVSGTRK